MVDPSEKKVKLVDRIKGRRHVIEMPVSDLVQMASARRGDPTFTYQEYFNGQTFVKPYYDADSKYESDPGDDEKTAKLVAFRALMTALHPDCEIVYADRSGPISSGWKISFRSWVQGVKIKASSIPTHVRTVMQWSPKETHEFLDLSVYKEKEQLLGVVFGCKDIDQVKRFLTPLDETQPLDKFVAQNCADGDTELVVTESSQSSESKLKRKRAVLGADADEQTAEVDGHEAAATADDITLVDTNVLTEASRFFNLTFKLSESFTDVKITRDKSALIFPTKGKHCVIKGGPHEGNNPYISVTAKGFRFKCPDDVCRHINTPLKAFAELPQKIAAFYMETIHPKKQEERRHQVQLAIRNFEQNIPGGSFKKFPLRPVYNETTLGRTRIIVPLDEKQWCVLHEKVHDTKTCWLELGSHGMMELRCALAPHRSYPDPPHLVQNIQNVFQVNNFIIQGDGDVMLDGHFSELAPIFEDEHLNRLMFESFDLGSAFQIGCVLHYLCRNIMGRSTGEDSRDWWVWNQHVARWTKSMLRAETLLSTIVADKYRVAMRWFRANTKDPQLEKIRAIKMHNILKRLTDRDAVEILRQAGKTFLENETCFESKLDANKDLLGFNGHVYDLRTDEYRPARPDDYVTRTCGYDLPAEDTSVQAQIMAFIGDIQENEEDVEYLLLWLASCLDGHQKDEVFHCLRGGGRNGKSALCTDLLCYTLGGNPNVETTTQGYYHTISSTMLTCHRPPSSSPTPDLLHLKGKRFAVASEPEKRVPVNVSTLKFLTGNDMITGRWCHQNEDITFMPQHSLAILTNDLLLMDAEDDAVYSRTRVITFPYKFTPTPVAAHEKMVDLDLKHKMKQWGPQFMRILLKYYKRYRQAGRLVPTTRILQDTNRVRDENDVFKQYIEEELVRSTRKEDRMWRSRMNESFKVWYMQRRKDCPDLPPYAKQTASQKLVAAMEKCGWELTNGVPDPDGQEGKGYGYYYIKKRQDV